MYLILSAVLGAAGCGVAAADDGEHALHRRGGGGGRIRIGLHWIKKGTREAIPISSNTMYPTSSVIQSPLLDPVAISVAI